jgi:hypothetical protein
MGGNRLLPLLGMAPVVETDAENVARLDRGKPLLDPSHFPGIDEVAKQVPLEERDAAVAMFVAEVLVAFGRKANDPHRGFSGGGSGV